MSAAIDLPTRSDARGSLTFMEAGAQVPFGIRRVYTMYGVPPGQDRGHHAHHECRQLLIVAAGGVTLVLDDGRTVEEVRCDRPDRGILIEPMVWHSLKDFAPGTVCVVLASHEYDEADYIRDREAFKQAVRGRAP